MYEEALCKVCLNLDLNPLLAAQTLSFCSSLKMEKIQDLDTWDAVLLVSVVCP